MQLLDSSPIFSRSSLSRCSTEISGPPSTCPSPGPPELSKQGRGKALGWRNLEEEFNLTPDLHLHQFFHLLPCRAGRRAVACKHRFFTPSSAVAGEGTQAGCSHAQGDRCC